MNDNEVTELVLATELGYERWADAKHLTKVQDYEALPWWRKILTEKPPAIRPLSMRDDWERIAKAHRG